MIYGIAKIGYRYVRCALNIRSLLRNGFRSRLSSLNISTIKGSSETLFVLGSGASINRISEKGWDNIKSNVSVGLNYWPIHDFIPSLLMFEIPRGNRSQFFFDVLELKKVEYSGVPLLLKGLYKDKRDFGDITEVHKNFPKELIPNIYLCSEFSLPGRDEQEYIHSLEWLFRLGFFKDRSYVETLAQYRGTVMCAIIFGIKAGFKKIVLCGIDLSDTKYFYEEERLYYENKGINVPPTGQIGDVHKTNVRINKALPISDAILLLDKLFFERMGGMIFTSSQNSALFPYLNYYEL
jgi:hypothetical protein